MPNGGKIPDSNKDTTVLTFCIDIPPQLSDNAIPRKSWAIRQDAESPGFFDLARIGYAEAITDGNLHGPQRAGNNKFGVRNDAPAHA